MKYIYYIDTRCMTLTLSDHKYICWTSHTNMAEPSLNETLQIHLSYWNEKRLWYMKWHIDLEWFTNIYVETSYTTHGRAIPEWSSANPVELLKREEKRLWYMKRHITRINFETSSLFRDPWYVWLIIFYWYYIGSLPLASHGHKPHFCGGRQTNIYKFFFFNIFNWTLFEVPYANECTS